VCVFFFVVLFVVVSVLVMTMKPLWFLDTGHCRISFLVFNGSEAVYDYGKAHGWLDMVPAAQRMGVSGDELDNHSWTLDVGLLYVSGDVTVRFYVFGEHCDQIQGVTGVLHPGAHKIDYGAVRGKLISFVSLNTALLAVHACKEKASAAAELARVGEAAAAAETRGGGRGGGGRGGGGAEGCGGGVAKAAAVAVTAAQPDQDLDGEGRGREGSSGREAAEFRSDQEWRQERRRERKRAERDTGQERREGCRGGKMVSGVHFGNTVPDERWQQGAEESEVDDAAITVTFIKSEIDGAHEDLPCKHFRESFSISLAFIRSFEEGLRKEGGSQPKHYDVNGVNLGLGPALQQMRLDNALQDLFASSPIELEVFCKGAVVNSRFGSIEPLTASELQLVRQHIQRKRSGTFSPLPLLLSPCKVLSDPLAHILSPADAPCDTAALVHPSRISGPADGAASDWSEVSREGGGGRGEGFASSSVLVGDQLGNRWKNQNQNSGGEMPLDGWLQGHFGEGLQRLSIGWVEEGLIDVDILHTALGSYRDEGALGMAGVPMHVLGVQGRGCLVNVMDVVTHLASLCGAITRKCGEVSGHVSPQSNVSPGCKRPAMKKSVLTRAEARLQSATPNETREEIPIGTPVGTRIGTHVGTPGGGQAAHSHTVEERCVCLQARARSEKLRVRRISLSENLLHADIPSSDLLSLYKSLCLYLSLLSNDMAAKLRCKCLLRQDLLRDPSNAEAVLQDRLIKDVIHRNMMPIHSLCLKV
jgi:hypothetical protein